MRGVPIHAKLQQYSELYPDKELENTSNIRLSCQIPVVHFI